MARQKNPYRKVEYILKYVWYVLLASVLAVIAVGALFAVPVIELGWPGVFITPGIVAFFVILALIATGIEKWWKRKEREYDERNRKTI